MKIKGVIINLKIKKVKNNNSKIYVGIFWSCCGISSVSDRSLLQLVIILKVYRPPPIHSQY